MLHNTRRQQYFCDGKVIYSFFFISLQVFFVSLMHVTTMDVCYIVFIQGWLLLAALTDCIGIVETCNRRISYKINKRKHDLTISRYKNDNISTIITSPPYHHHYNYSNTIIITITSTIPVKDKDNDLDKQVQSYLRRTFPSCF